MIKLALEVSSILLPLSNIASIKVEIFQLSIQVRSRTQEFWLKMSTLPTELSGITDRHHAFRQSLINNMVCDFTSQQNKPQVKELH